MFTLTSFISRVQKTIDCTFTEDYIVVLTLTSFISRGQKTIDYTFTENNIVLLTLLELDNERVNQLLTTIKLSSDSLFLSPEVRKR